MRKIFNFQFSIFKNESGQALVTLLFFIMIGITVTSAAITILIANSFGSSYAEQGTTAYFIAESGAEDALIKLVRNPSFTSSGYSLAVNGGTAFVTVGNGYATSSGTLANTVRKVELQTV